MAEKPAPKMLRLTSIPTSLYVVFMYKYVETSRICSRVDVDAKRASMSRLDARTGLILYLSRMCASFFGPCMEMEMEIRKTYVVTYIRTRETRIVYKKIPRIVDYTNLTRPAQSIGYKQKEDQLPILSPSLPS